MGVFLGGHDARRRLEAAGVSGCLERGQSVLPIEQALAAAQQGQVIIGWTGISTPGQARGAEATVSPEVPDGLNAQILDLLAVGYRDKEAADELGFSPSAIHHRMEALEHDLEARARFQFGCLTVWNGLGIPKSPSNRFDCLDKLP